MFDLGTMLRHVWQKAEDNKIIRLMELDFNPDVNVD